MRVITRLAIVLCAVGCSLSFPCFGQAVSLGVAGASPADPGYAQVEPISISSLPASYAPTALTLDATTGQILTGAAGTASVSSRANVASGPLFSNFFDFGDIRPNAPTMDGVNSLATFDRAFDAQAGPSIHRDFRFTMIGNDPQLGGSTVYPANIDEVSLQLLNADGSVFKTVPFAPFEAATLGSPNFVPSIYKSGFGIQYADAIHRAEFFNAMKQDWHTVIIPKVVNRGTITVPFFVNVRLSNGNIVQARSYFTSTAPDGSTIVFMLQPLFNVFFDNEVIQNINQGNFTTNGINMELFPNTYLFSFNQTNPNLPGGCCVLGFHTYFLDTSSFPESRWVTEYASWISPGIFGGGFQDVTALSHETSESFADPFVDNATPNWQFPGVPANSTVCQANLEDGDPIEGLANPTTTIPIQQLNGTTFIFHPQNIVLYQWFEMGATSNALDGAFSFPNEALLPHSALPCP